METKTIPDYPRGITFEQVWAALMEDREQFQKMKEEAAERQKEADRRHEQMQKEAAERQKEAAERQAKWESEAAQRQKDAEQRQKDAEQRQKEAAEREKAADLRRKEFDRQLEKTKRLIEENGKQIGGLHRSFGELAEHLVAPGIVRRFNEIGYKFEGIADGNYRILDKQGNIRTEIDLLLENDDHIIAVEVKTRPVVKDVEHHIGRLEILREYKDKHHDTRKIQGAIAGAVFGTEEKKATLEAGLFVIEQSGDTMRINVPGGFKPREW